MTKQQLFDIIDSQVGLNEVFDKLRDMGATNFGALEQEFIQNVSNHSINFYDRLKSQISLFFWERNKSEALYLVICSLNQNQFHQIKEVSLKANEIRYKENSLLWQPFEENESIEALLKEYATKGYEVVFEPFIYDDANFRTYFQKNRKFATLIIDCHALFVYREQFLKLDDFIETGGFIFPICQSYSPRIKTKLLQKQAEVFTDTKHSYYSDFKVAYPYIELNVSTKYDFFRRLTNIATTRFGFGELKTNVAPKQILTHSDSIKKSQNAEDKRL